VPNSLREVRSERRLYWHRLALGRPIKNRLGVSQTSAPRSCARPTASKIAPRVQGDPAPSAAYLPSRHRTVPVSLPCQMKTMRGRGGGGCFSLARSHTALGGAIGHRGEVRGCDSKTTTTCRFPVGPMGLGRLHAILRSMGCNPQPAHRSCPCTPRRGRAECRRHRLSREVNVSSVTFRPLTPRIHRVHVHRVLTLLFLAFCAHSIQRAQPLTASRSCRT
jgi:hypothetical protein